MIWLKGNWHRALAHGAGVLTFAWLATVYIFSLAPLSERFVMLRSGTLGLIFLVASFACTPVSRWFWSPASQIRRALGLYGFIHITLHIIVYAVAENGLDFALIWRDLDERRAMAIGLVAFGLLIPLALTSTAGWQKRLGKRWRILHRLIYLAVPLSLWHYLWLDRDIITTPLIFAIIIGLLFAARIARYFARKQTRPNPN